MEARTQMHYACRCEITDAMRFVAEREEISPELVRDEIAIGRLIIPANVRHFASSLEPMAIGKVAKVKINANIGNSAVLSDINGEIEKLGMAVKYGADTGDEPRHRRKHRRNPAGKIVDASPVQSEAFRFT